MNPELAEIQVRAVDASGIPHLCQAEGQRPFGLDTRRITVRDRIQVDLLGRQVLMDDGDERVDSLSCHRRALAWRLSGKGSAFNALAEGPRLEATARALRHCQEVGQPEPIAAHVEHEHVHLVAARRYPRDGEMGAERATGHVAHRGQLQDRSGCDRAGIWNLRDWNLRVEPDLESVGREVSSVLATQGGPDSTTWSPGPARDGSMTVPYLAPPTSTTPHRGRFGAVGAGSTCTLSSIANTSRLVASDAFDPQATKARRSRPASSNATVP
jgi:hypothetical protein